MKSIPIVQTYSIASKENAEDVVEQMRRILERDNVVLREDFYNLLGIDTNYTDHKCGWTNLDNAKILELDEGFVIALPPVKEI